MTMKNELAPLKAYIKPISMSNYSIFVVEDSTEKNNIIPAVSITMRSDIAEYLVKLVNKDNETTRKEDKKLPVTFAYGDIVRIKIDSTEGVITAVLPDGEERTVDYGVNGMNWFEQEELEFISKATIDSLKKAFWWERQE